MSTRTLARFWRAAIVAVLSASVVVLAGCGSAPTRQPPDPPAAQATAKPDLTYLALGDSTVFGNPDSCDECITYPYIVRGKLAELTGRSVQLWDGSQPNEPTLSMLADEIRNDAWRSPTAGQNTPSPAAAVAGADIVTITMNDNSMPWAQTPDACGYVYDAACLRKLQAPFVDDLKDVLGQILRLRKGQPTAVRLTTEYNALIPGKNYEPQFPARAIAQSRTSAKSFLDKWNAELCTLAPRYGASCVDTYHGINGKNGLSPLPGGWFSAKYPDLNQSGQKFIAAQMMYLGWQPLKLGRS